MVAGAKYPQYLLVGDDGGERHDPPAEGLPEHVHVGLDILVVTRERPARAGEPRLDLVGDHEHPVLVAELPRRP